MDLVQAYGPDYPIIKISEPKLVVSKMKDLDMLNSKDSIILSAQSILELYSPRTLQTGEMNLSEIYCFEDSVFLVIDSLLNTSPPSIQMIMQNKDKFSSLPVRSDTTTKHVIIKQQIILDQNFYKNHFCLFQSYAWVNESDWWHQYLI